MLFCAVCAEGPKHNDRWTSISPMVGCDPLPNDSKLAHISCKRGWETGQSSLYRVLEASPGKTTGDVTDIGSDGMWFVR